MVRTFGRILATIIGIAFVGPAFSAEPSAYPSRPVRMVVPFPPGGGADIVARLIGERLTEHWRQQVIIDNRGGAGGTIGTALVSRAAPDGYTLMMASSNHPINAALYPKLSYDPLKSFEPIALVGHAPLVLAVNPAVGVSDVKALIALAQAQPGKLTYGSAGNASTPHLAGELLESMANVDMLHVPYKGSAQALTDLLGGQLNMAFNNILSVASHVRSGKLRALATTGSSRAQLLATVPTMQEAGVAGYEVIQWWGVIAPAATSAANVAKLASDLEQLLRQEIVRDRLRGQGVEATFMDPTSFRKMIDAEVSKWSAVVKAANIRLE